MRFSLAESLRCVLLVAIACGLAIGIEPRQTLSGPLFMVKQGATFRTIGYSWAVVNLVIAGWYFVRPSTLSAWISVLGIVGWLCSGVFVRNVADW